MIPQNTRTATFFNTRIPVEWHDYLEPLARARNMRVSTLIKKSVRSKLSIHEELQMATDENMTISAVRARTLMDVFPDMPKWDMPPSPARSNTPTARIENDEDKPSHRFILNIPLSQAVYYGLRRMAAERGMETELFARKVLTQAYYLTDTLINKGDDHAD